jgi:hypothetical protein
MIIKILYFSMLLRIDNDWQLLLVGFKIFFIVSLTIMITLCYTFIDNIRITQLP